MNFHQAIAACATAVGGAWVSLQAISAGHAGAGAAILITTTLTALAIAGARNQ